MNVGKWLCLLLCLLQIPFLNTYSHSVEVYASEDHLDIDDVNRYLEEGIDLSEAEKVLKEKTPEMEPFREAEEQAQGTLGIILQKAIKIIPYIGIVMFVIGLIIGVLSTKNKGMRRYGIRFGILGASLMFILYVGFAIYYDFQCTDEPLQIAQKREEITEHERIYFDNIEQLDTEGLSFILFSHEKWYHDAALAGRRYYTEAALLFGGISVGLGILFCLVTRRDRNFFRWSLVGMCVVVPLVLVIGYQYIAV